MEIGSQQSDAVSDYRTSATKVFIGTPMPWPDGFLSMDSIQTLSE